MKDCANIAWVAGWLEGEGSFGAYNRANRTDKNYRIAAASTDQDVILKVKSILGGRVYGPYKRKKNSNWKPVYYWDVGKKQDIQRVAKLILPYMCSRRRAAIEGVLMTIEGTGINANGLR